MRSSQRLHRFALFAISAIAWSTIAAGAEASTPAPVEVGNDFGTFFLLGVRHILSGPDHLLFLLGLWIVCRDIRSLLLIVCSFTIAHSLTLVAATLNLVRIPGALVEVLIACTIAYVGIENFIRKTEPRHRVAVTFLFGLVHGFGLSNVLRKAGIVAEGSSIAEPLLAFNLGVEVGQLATAICLPIIWKLHEKRATRNMAIRVVSAVVAAAGLFWIVVRLRP